MFNVEVMIFMYVSLIHDKNLTQTWSTYPFVYSACENPKGRPAQSFALFYQHRYQDENLLFGILT